MSLRLVQLLLNEESESDSQLLARLETLLDEHNVVDHWCHRELRGNRMLLQAMIRQQDVEPLIDELQSRFGRSPGFRLTTTAIDFTLPEVVEPEKPVDPADKPEKTYGWQRLSRQELLSRMSTATRLDRNYLAMVVLSVVVAATGLLTNNVAVVIAAMVIAPLLGPNMALAKATTTGDNELLRRAVRVNLAGMVLALCMAMGIGLAVHLAKFDLAKVQEIVERTKHEWHSLLLALAAGAAGVLSFTSGVSGTLIGVMVAVALMPPLIVVGLFLGAGQPTNAGHALILLATNIIGVNVAGVGTFLLQGVRPTRWWEAKRATALTRRALLLWCLLLVALAGLLSLPAPG